jgi:nucleoside diphosphate kinase
VIRRARRPSCVPDQATGRSVSATTGSIRGDYALEVGQNMVHGSDSNESAAREAALFFPELA